MTDDHKEMIEELIRDWDERACEEYITRLNQKKETINEYITLIREVMRKKKRKVFDTGGRHGN